MHYTRLLFLRITWESITLLLLLFPLQVLHAADSMPILLEIAACPTDVNSISVAIANTSNEDIYIYFACVARDGKLRGDWLDVLDEKGVRQLYTGIYISQQEPTRDEYMRMSKGGRLAFKILPASSYRIQGQGPFTVSMRASVQYYTKNTKDTTKAAEICEVTSNKILTTFKKWQP